MGRLTRIKLRKSCGLGGRPKSAETGSSQRSESGNAEIVVSVVVVGGTIGGEAVAVVTEHTKIVAEASVEAVVGPQPHRDEIPIKETEMEIDMCRRAAAPTGITPGAVVRPPAPFRPTHKPLYPLLDRGHDRLAIRSDALDAVIVGRLVRPAIDLATEILARGIDRVAVLENTSLVGTLAEETHLLPIAPASRMAADLSPHHQKGVDTRVHQADRDPHAERDDGRLGLVPRPFQDHRLAVQNRGQSESSSAVAARLIGAEG